jgi:hypothetical protein
LIFKSHVSVSDISYENRTAFLLFLLLLVIALSGNAYLSRIGSFFYCSNLLTNWPRQMGILTKSSFGLFGGVLHIGKAL